MPFGRRIPPFALIAFVLTALSAGDLRAEEDNASDEDVYFPVESVNDGLPRLDGPPPNLETPLACVENFYFSCQAGDFDRAARSLDLKFIPVE